MELLLFRLSPGSRRVGSFGRRFGAWLYHVVLLFAWLLLCGYLVFKLVEREQMIQMLPAGIEPSGTKLIAGEFGFREGCGAAIFGLSDVTRRRLQREGLGFLETTRQSRGHRDDYYAFGRWRSTPLVSSVTSEGGWRALWCAGNGPLIRRVNLAVQSSGGFYSEKPEGILVVLPDEGLIVFGYDG